MKRRSVVGGAFALVIACGIMLAGCSGGLPIPNPFAGLLDTTSVAEARAAKQERLTPSLSAPDLVSDGVLTVGLQGDSVTAPFAIVAADGTVSGMDVDVASAIADELGLRVRFVEVSGIAQPLAEGQCDIVMDASSDHAGGAAVVGSYYENATSFFHKGVEGVISVEELNAKTVGLQQGSVSEGVLNRTGLVMTQRTFANLNEAFDALNRDSVDYVLCDTYPGAYLAAGYENLNFAGALNAPVLLGIGVSADKATLQTAVLQALDAVTSKGVMSIIRSRWVGGMPSITASDEVRNVPGAVVASELPSEGGAGVAVDTPQDGSTAGSNAVVLSD